LSFDSPTKPSKKDTIKVVDDERLPHPLQSLTEDAQDDILPIRRKFEGDVDLPESMSNLSWLFFDILTSSLGEEPLLKESRRHFVLFPIQYHEVPVGWCAIYFPWLTTVVDMADVQEGRSFILDCRGDGPLQGCP